jgi:hypothetical protein
MNQDQVTKMSWYSGSLMILTSIHHIYGAIIYNTPWRLHVLMLSVPVTVITLLANMWMPKASGIKKSAIFWLLIVVTLVPCLILIGLFEGVYNHILKNILFFGGLSPEKLLKLFPPPTYEMPDDLIFEVTGILQGLFVFPLTASLLKVLTVHFKKGYTSPSSE